MELPGIECGQEQLKLKPDLQLAWHKDIRAPPNGALSCCPAANRFGSAGAPAAKAITLPRGKCSSSVVGRHQHGRVPNRTMFPSQCASLWSWKSRALTERRELYSVQGSDWATYGSMPQQWREFILWDEGINSAGLRAMLSIATRLP
ncbi:hypothetical protein DPEC_G00015060 [Dallia pectoralis]|uniref:Uncharacterized protein n=1 Tax=Dallia pectoralis TaxID=75939 RepID=A0ACC2HMG9_DALPE|nr:hypothetical protein DPEC_G00015060 [Dallia pectoralis]